MRRPALLAVFGALFAGRSVAAQQVPGRDLLDFPLGLNAEAPALGSLSGLGFWNPASVYIADGQRARIGVGTMSAPVDLGISTGLATVAMRWRYGLTLGASVASASVNDLLRTDSDPQSIGDEIAYRTTVVSLLAARHVRRVTIGAALRSRDGQLDGDHRQSVSLDAGVITDGLGRRDLRLAASTFLASPLGARRERTTLLGAADARVVGADSLRTVRGGIGASVTDGLSREAYGYVGGRFDRVEGRLGAAYTAIYGRTNWRPRLGLAFHHRGYVIAVAREESAGHLAATYQFSLSSLFR